MISPLVFRRAYRISLFSGLGQIGSYLTQIKGIERALQISAPQDGVLESQIAEKSAVEIDAVEKIADKSVFACPDCSGNL